MQYCEVLIQEMNCGFTWLSRQKVDGSVLKCTDSRDEHLVYLAYKIEVDGSVLRGTHSRDELWVYLA